MRENNSYEDAMQESIDEMIRKGGPDEAVKFAIAQIPVVLGAIADLLEEFVSSVERTDIAHTK